MRTYFLEINLLLIAIVLISIFLVHNDIYRKYVLSNQFKNPEGSSQQVQAQVQNQTQVQAQVQVKDEPGGQQKVLSFASTSPTAIQWGSYVGDGIKNLPSFETLVGKKVDILAVFVGWNDDFPTELLNSVGNSGKTLLIFWEPEFGYDNVLDSSHDKDIQSFASAAKMYGKPIILVPFPEMNLNEEAWGYGKNGNSAKKFVAAWQYVHNYFVDVPNVKFAIDYNNESIPDTIDNKFEVYYPGNAYVDYVGLSGFNYGSPWQTFDQLFSIAIKNVSIFDKPLYILSTASAAGSEKAEWIYDGLGNISQKYPSIKGWVWFNYDKEEDWEINSDNASLQAFRSVIP